MAFLSKKKKWNIAQFIVRIASIKLVKSGARKGWRLIRKNEPPVKPVKASGHNDWVRAIVWSTIIGLLVGVAQRSSKEGLAIAWKKINGETPPV